MPVQDYVERLRDLPIMPEVAAKVVAASGGGLDMSFKDLESIIKVDPGLTAKILKIANSALYARQREIKSLQTAITLLGFKNIKSLVLLLTASNLFPRMRRTPFHRAFWRRSLLSAFLSRGLAVRCARGDLAEELFIAGLLQLFGVNHRVLGGALLERWNFPGLYADTAREHGTLNITSAHKPLIILVSTASLVADCIDLGSVSPSRQELFTQLLPYTCLGGSELPSLARAYEAELAGDKLFQEFQGLVS
jgi:HD-like signal output (HDOD) protein